MFRLRRQALVDAVWHVGFITAFALAGILALGILLENKGHTVAGSLGLYIAALCLAGIGGGLLGAFVGHLAASAWEAIDLRLHPRRYEDRDGNA